MDLICPKCGSTRIVHMDYGGSFSSGEMDSQKPAYKCKACKQEFGTVCGSSHYSNIVQSITISILKPYENKDSISLKLSKNENGIKYRIDIQDCGAIVKGNISEMTWKNICNALFNEIFLDSWKNRVYNPKIIDGTIWDVEVKFEKKHALQIHGCNGYSPYWNELIALVGPILDANGIDSSIYKV